ncbi:hypothetical protein [Photobacterium rosenbergii]|uniref:hypothetical protein n=1 Tax=Photobacterium rosenbergii TaxID=294936 RepID=UPI001C99D502|nr:hypothetical protein [Photobacterium rosenbergii]MBY5947736.1 hypothetical protein [Photobacterium rosenbergii]
MFIVYLFLGVLFSWLAIKSFGAAFGGNVEDEHALIAEGDPDFDLDEESHWDDEYCEEDDKWVNSSDHEFDTDWCPEEIKEEIE